MIHTYSNKTTVHATVDTVVVELLESVLKMARAGTVQGISMVFARSDGGREYLNAGTDCGTAMPDVYEVTAPGYVDNLPKIARTFDGDSIYVEKVNALSR